MSLKHWLIAFFFIANIKNANAQNQHLKDLIAGKTNFNDIKLAADNYFKNLGIDLNSIKQGGGIADNEFIKYQRWEWYWKHRVLADGSFPDFQSQYQIYRDLNTNSSNKKTRGKQWRNISQTSSTGGYSGMGRLKTVAFHPTDTNIIYVGAPVGGIWKTTTGGNNWTPLGDGLPYCSVGSIVVDHTNPNILFVTIGDNEGWWQYGLGIYKSTNGGNTWVATSQSSSFTDNIVYYKLMMSPVDHNVMYSAQSNGFWKTTDGGITWTLNRTGTYVDFEFKPNDPNTIYISKKGSSSNSEVFKTTNAGAVWAQITNLGLPNNTIEIAVTPADANYIGLGVDGNGAKKFYLSTDAGATAFVLKNNAIDDNAIIQFSPTNKNRVYCGYVTNYRSTNGGSNWTKITNWYNDGVLAEVHADNHYSDINPLLPNYIYVCNDGGLYRYNEITEEWKDLSNGLIITEFYKIAHSQQDSIFVIGGTQDNGGRKRVSSTSWEATNGGDGMEVAVNPINDQTIYTTYYGGMLYRSYDQWDNDTYYDISADPNSGAWVTPYLIDPNSPTTLVAGYNDVWRSTNEGDTWTQISSNITGGSDNLEVLDVAPSNSNVIYTGKGNDLYYTSNLGASWVTKLVPDSSGTFEDISSVMVHPKNQNKVYVTKSGYGNKSKVYMSLNNGTTWTNITYNIPNVPVNCIQFDRLSDSTNMDIYLGTDVGVFYKKDSDLTWQYFGIGMPNTQVSDLEIFYPTGKLRAGTYGRGIWENDLKRTDYPVSTMNINTQTNEIVLLQNPINQSIELSISSDQNNQYNVRIFDESGRTLQINNFLVEKGKLNYSVPVQTLSNGIYLIEITDNRSTKKVFKIVKTNE